MYEYFITLPVPFGGSEYKVLKEKKMQKLLYAIILILFLFSCIGSEKEVDMAEVDKKPADPVMLPGDLVGSWEGALDVGGINIRLIFNVTQDQSGQLMATMDSPDQGASGIPVSGIKISGEDVLFEAAVAAGSFRGVPAAGGVLEGQWSQGGQVYSLNLSRSDAPVDYSRPQDPVKPYPYQAEEVTFNNIAAGITLAGTLTYPSSGEAAAAVVLISGSGPQNRDEEIMGHRPFLVLADYLTRRGIAVLRYDDRGVGGSGGDPLTSTSADFAGDVRAALTYLKQQVLVKVLHFGLIGHSEGGMIAPLVARDQGQVDFIVLMAGPGYPGKDILLQQNRAILEAKGMEPDMIRQMNEINNSLYELALTQEIDAGITGQIKAILKDTGQFKDEAEIEEQVKSLVTPWFRFFLGYDPVPVLQQVQVPVLALNGSLDLQVIAPQNLNAIAAALQAGGNTRYETKLFPGLNHLFQTAKTGLVDEYNQIDETIAPQVLTYLGDWILNITVS